MKIHSAIAAVSLLFAGLTVPAFAADTCAPGGAKCCQKADCCKDGCKDDKSCCKDGCCDDAEKNCCAGGSCEA
jgi:hypothetical protein